MNTIAFGGANTFVSTWESIKDKVSASMDETIEAYQALT